jgi:hypothetical protein
MISNAEDLIANSPQDTLYVFTSKSTHHLVTNFINASNLIEDTSVKLLQHLAHINHAMTTLMDSIISPDQPQRTTSYHYLQQIISTLQEEICNKRFNKAQTSQKIDNNSTNNQVDAFTTNSSYNTPKLLDLTQLL